MGCCIASAGPPPPEHVNLVGTWTAPGTILLLDSYGHVAYTHQTLSSKVSVKGPVSEWRADGFGSSMCLCCNTNWTITAPPEQDEEGRWKMTVNHIVMTKEPS